MKTHIRSLVLVTLCCFFAFPAAAQGAGLEEFGTLGNKIITFLQFVGGIAATGGLIFAGIKFTSGDQQAKDYAIKVLIGSALIFCAVIVVNFVKGNF